MPAKLTIEDCNNLAKEKKGFCLSSEYIGSTQNMVWKCEFGHEFITSYTSIKSSRVWCHTCSKRQKWTIDDCISIAESHGGKCLTEKYINNRVKMDWACAKGHKWSTSFGSIKNSKTWCPVCVGYIPHSIELCHTMAEMNNGKCLSTSYTNVLEKLNWECQFGHKFKKTLATVLYRKSWCNRCARTKYVTLEDCQRVARERGGECLDSVYLSSKKPLSWKCRNGHIWKANFNTVGSAKRPTWCQVCANKKYVNEQMFRKMFEYIFEKDFPSVSPDWLINPKTNRKLQIDGFNSELKIGFEYNGGQHYRFLETFHKTKSEFEYQKYKDKIKTKKFKELKYVLIVIPECPKKLQHDKIKDFLIKQIKKNKLNVPDKLLSLDVNKFIRE